MVIVRTDSKGVAGHLVSAASAGLKVFPFDIHPELRYFLAIRMVLVILRTAMFAVAGNARRSLGWILPTSYRARQEENAENRKYFGRGGVSVRNLIRTRFSFPALRARSGWATSTDVTMFLGGESLLGYHLLVREREKQELGRKHAPHAQ